MLNQFSFTSTYGTHSLCDKAVKSKGLAIMTWEDTDRFRPESLFLQLSSLSWLKF